HVASRHEAGGFDVLEHDLPQGASTLSAALAEPLDLATVRPQPEPEHVRAHRSTDPLALELRNQVQKNLIRDLSEGSAQTSSRCELRDQNRGLSDDRVDQ